MNEQLEVLAALAALDDSWVANRDALARIPGSLGAVDAKLAVLKKAASDSAAALERSARTRREKEGAAQDAETQRVRLEAQLPQLKTPEAYTARMHEIDTLARRRSTLETEILELLEREEAESAARAHREHALAEHAPELAEARSALEAQRASLAERKRELDAARSAHIARLAPQVRARYERAFQGLGGHAVSRVTATSCGGCHATLPPQVVADVKKGEVVQMCEACGRLCVWAGS